MEEYERWVKQAENTLRSAAKDREAGDYNWCCFKAQQAAEFAVKGLLYGLGLSAIGHSLVRLLGELRERGMEIEGILPLARTLDRHHIPTRYANAHAEGAPFEFYDDATADEALRCAKAIIDFVKKVAERG